MTETESRLFLIDYLLKECKEQIAIPSDEDSQRRLLRSLMNVRPPVQPDGEFLRVQDEYLQSRISHKKIIDTDTITQIAPDICLIQGDITTLKCDAIVNAANSQMLGCFCPCHGCIDNAIHTYAGVQLRLECAEIMQKQGHEEETGCAKITKAYNLPCKYVIHTVGPIVYGKVTKRNKTDLENCYQSCLSLADKNNVKSIAFCCISTGEFHFPNGLAAEIAVNTVKGYKAKTGSRIKVIFNVFKDTDYEIYYRLLRNQ